MRRSMVLGRTSWRENANAEVLKRSVERKEADLPLRHRLQLWALALGLACQPVQGQPSEAQGTPTEAGVEEKQADTAPQWPVTVFRAALSQRDWRPRTGTASLVSYA